MTHDLTLNPNPQPAVLYIEFVLLVTGRRVHRHSYIKNSGTYTDIPYLTYLLIC